MKTATMILGVIGSDCHAVGNKILERVFSDAGFKVINLGVMVSQDEYIDAAIETGAEVIMVSSLYGHGEIDCQGFRERCVERGLDEIIIYVGGNLVIGKTPREQVIAKFEQMGYDRVFMPDVDLESVIELLREDIKKQRLGNESISKY
ncbi:MAG: methylaspartate mutase subunit S [Victivallaceae bacterium]|nr:methylaspartate mutase subunit S [Victivallaceae bacterium]MDD4181063.1 methylaspartate mutase subunit S [Victivallaceae bacterium]